MWLNPLPGETVIAAIVGAVLSTVMAQFEYFKIAVWTEARFPLYLTALVLSFGVAIHIYCAACYLKRNNIRKAALCVSAFIIFTLVLLNATLPIGMTEDGSIQFKPNHGNMLMAGVLLLWLASLRALTQIKAQTES